MHGCSWEMLPERALGFGMVPRDPGREDTDIAESGLVARGGLLNSGEA